MSLNIGNAKNGNAFLALPEDFLSQTKAAQKIQKIFGKTSKDLLQLIFEATGIKGDYIISPPGTEGQPVGSGRGPGGQAYRASGGTEGLRLGQVLTVANKLTVLTGKDTKEFMPEKKDFKGGVSKVYINTNHDYCVIFESDLITPQDYVDWLFNKFGPKVAKAKPKKNF